jgi:uncharacterized protein
MNTSSPCVDICKLDGNGVCIGCFRTKEEIARWLQMEETEKSAVVARLNEHRKICLTDKFNPCSSVSIRG